MKIKNIIKGLFLSLLFLRCSGDDNNSSAIDGTLKDYYQYCDQIKQDELHFSELQQEYNLAYGKNDATAIKAVEDKFAATQKKGIELVLKKYPSGSLQFPFEENGISADVKFKSVYISGYSYPWSSADRNSWYVTFEYMLKRADFHFLSVRVEFYDTEGDLINETHIALNKSGKTTIYMKPESEFRKFLKLKIVSTQN